MKRTLILAVFLIGFFGNSAFAQEEQDSIVYRLETVDGSEFIGMLVSATTEYVILNTEIIGEIKIARSQIKSMEMIRSGKLVAGQIWSENPQATRYFWSPSGYGLRKGEGYYQNVWVLFNHLAVGVSDNVSIGIGIMPLFLFGGSPFPVWVTPKFSIPIKRDKFNLGGGALIGTVLGEENAGFGILFGSGTFGDKDKNLTIGLGTGYAGGEFAGAPIINVAAMIRTGPKGYILTENYYVGVSEENVLLLSFGGRRTIQRTAIDFGGLLPLVEGDGIFIIPWLGITFMLSPKDKH